MKRKIPFISLSIIALSLLCLILSRIARASYSFSDFIEKNISSYLRLAMEKLTGWFSFSLFEVFIISLPILIAGVITLSVIAFKRRRGGIFILRLFSFVCHIFVTYTLTTGISYHTTPVAEKIGLDTSDEITVEDIAYTAERVIEEIDFLTARLTYLDGESRMEYSFAELSERISEAYAIFNGEHLLFLDYASVAKPIKGSETMTAFRLSGIYTFYTGESNINMAYPDYNLPFSVAHELAHARGVMREDEANFVAFLVCIGSPDPFIRYSGYVNLLEYLISAIYKMDKDIYNGILEKIDGAVLNDIRASSAVSREHANGFIGNLSNKFNDMYLKANGTAGTVSYSMVTKLAVAYYK
ncbi:MAG: DUF3810 domain-containing protein [Clostridia bacterium]|nr:DUF3810 domain-containing protein [Clostridia bacterium]